MSHADRLMELADLYASLRAEAAKPFADGEWTNEKDTQRDSARAALREACEKLCGAVEENERRIDAARLRLRDAKAIHSRWYDREIGTSASESMNGMEQVVYSAMLYLDGEKGPNRPDLAHLTKGTA